MWLRSTEGQDSAKGGESQIPHYPLPRCTQHPIPSRNITTEAIGIEPSFHWNSNDATVPILQRGYQHGVEAELPRWRMHLLLNEV